MNKEELLKMAREAGISFTPLIVDGVEYTYRYVHLDDGIGGDEFGCIELFMNAILERAAQECENLKWVDGQPIPSNAEFARLVRSLKTKTQD